MIFCFFFVKCSFILLILLPFTFVPCYCRWRWFTYSWGNFTVAKTATAKTMNKTEKNQPKKKYISFYFPCISYNNNNENWRIMPHANSLTCLGNLCLICIVQSASLYDFNQSSAYFPIFLCATNTFIQQQQNKKQHLQI